MKLTRDYADVLFRADHVLARPDVTRFDHAREILDHVYLHFVLLFHFRLRNVLQVLLFFEHTSIPFRDPERQNVDTHQGEQARENVMQ